MLDSQVVSTKLCTSLIKWKSGMEISPPGKGPEEMHKKKLKCVHVLTQRGWHLPGQGGEHYKLITIPM